MPIDLIGILHLIYVCFFDKVNTDKFYCIYRMDNQVVKFQIDNLKYILR